MTSIADLRRDYALASLDLADVVADPIAQFRRWFDNATAAAIAEPNAMTLATVGADGAPDARIVLLKGVDARGFSFYTDYRSQKGRDLLRNPQAALVFFWGSWSARCASAAPSRSSSPPSRRCTTTRVRVGAALVRGPVSRAA